MKRECKSGQLGVQHLRCHVTQSIRTPRRVKASPLTTPRCAQSYRLASGHSCALSLTPVPTPENPRALSRMDFLRRSNSIRRPQHHSSGHRLKGGKDRWRRQSRRNSIFFVIIV